MSSIKYDDLALAFDFVSSSAPMEHEAYISLDTGQIYWVSELNPTDEEVPDDLETSDRYIAVPHKNDLGLGKNLALRFVAAELPDRYRDAEAFFRRKGAYARFKQLLESAGLLERWYKFEETSVAQAFRNWCVENEIRVIEGEDEPSA